MDFELNDEQRLLTDSARALTQPAVACCAPTFRVDSIAIQENPATSMATATSS